MSKHTKGAWRYLQSGIAGEFVIKIDTHPDLAIGIASGIDTEVNARLIASAPELYKALNRFVPSSVFKEDGRWFKGSKDGDASQVEPIIAEALDALAKARGEV